MTEIAALANHDELSIIARVLAGDKSSFELLMKKNEQFIKQMVQKIVRDVDMVEDVVQEVFLKAYKALAQFRGEAQFSTWLYRIANNTALKMLAEVKRETVHVTQLEQLYNQPNTGLFSAVTYETPEQLLQAKQTNELLQSAIDLLSPRLQQVLMLREINGLSYAEIAHTMQCSIGTVRSRISRAREAIFNKLQKIL